MFTSALSEHITHEERIILKIGRQVNDHLIAHMNEAEKELRTLVEDEQ
jgi:hypothetical protein